MNKEIANQVSYILGYKFSKHLPDDMKKKWLLNYQRKLNEYIDKCYDESLASQK